MPIQRNRYKGRTPRTWLCASLRDVHGKLHRFDFLADTGSPYALLLNRDVFDRFAFNLGNRATSNFDENMPGGWVNLCIPELRFDELAKAYCGADAARIAAKSDPDFVGILGLPILRKGRYGGDKDHIWFEYL